MLKGGSFYWCFYKVEAMAIWILEGGSMAVAISYK